jgi:hypothetical protein
MKAKGLTLTDDGRSKLDKVRGRTEIVPERERLGLPLPEEVGESLEVVES